MIRRAGNPFRISGGRVNLQDAIYDVAFGGWTRGATQLDQITFRSSTVPQFTVLGFSISARLFLAIDGNNPPYGKFGAIIGGLTTAQAPTFAAPTPPYVTPALPEPADMALAGPVWDPAVNPLPQQFSRSAASTPFNAGGPAGIPIGLSQTLPVPVPIPNGAGACIGLWLRPSLQSASGNNIPVASLVVCDAIWSVTYDDGT